MLRVVSIPFFSIEVGHNLLFMDLPCGIGMNVPGGDIPACFGGDLTHDIFGMVTAFPNGHQAIEPLVGKVAQPRMISHLGVLF
jgi:hypothetical protein